MLRRVIAAVLITAMTGCTTVGPVANPREFIPIKHPGQVWLVRSDGTTLLMYKPVFQGDTLLGVVRGQGQRRIPRTEIKGVEAVVPAPDKTRLFLIGGAALAVAGMFWAVRHQSNIPPSPKDFCAIDPDDC